MQGGWSQEPATCDGPTLNYYTNPWMWSKCSRKYITEFLRVCKPILHSTTVTGCCWSCDIGLNSWCWAAHVTVSTCICFLLNILNWDGNNVICSKRNRLFFLSSVTYWDHLCCLCIVCLLFLQLICWSFIISTGYGECLLDEPVSRPYSFVPAAARTDIQRQ